MAAVVVGAVVKRIHHVEGGGVRVNPPSARVRFKVGVVGRGQAIFKSQLAVVQNVLTDVAQVDEEPSPRLVLRIFIERVHHPKLNVLDVGGLKVRGGQRPLDAGPTLTRVEQRAVGIQARRHIRPFEGLIVVRTPLGWPVRQIQRGQVCWTPHHARLTVVSKLVQLLQLHLSRAVVPFVLRAHLAIRIDARLQDGIDGVPAQSSTIVVRSEVIFQRRFRKQVADASVLATRGGRQKPAVDRPQINGALGSFKVVDVRNAPIVLVHGSGMAWNEVSPFRTDVKCGLGRRTVKRQSVHQLGDQVAFCLP